MIELSAEEIHRTVGMTLEQLKQARKELACLDVKAEQMAKNIETVARVLRGHIKGNCTSGYFIVEPSQGVARINWPTIQDMNDVLRGRERLTEEIAELEKKAQRMGYNI